MRAPPAAPTNPPPNPLPRPPPPRPLTRHQPRRTSVACCCNRRTTRTRRFSRRGRPRSPAEGSLPAPPAELRQLLAPAVLPGAPRRRCWRREERGALPPWLLESIFSRDQALEPARRGCAPPGPPPDEGDLLTVVPAVRAIIARECVLGGGTHPDAAASSSSPAQSLPPHPQARKVAVAALPFFHASTPQGPPQRLQAAPAKLTRTHVAPAPHFRLQPAPCSRPKPALSPVWGRAASFLSGAGRRRQPPPSFTVRI